MRVLQVNNFYPFSNTVNTKKQSRFHYPYGGTEALMQSTTRLLESHGHKVIFFSMQHPDKLWSEYSDYFVPYQDLNNCDGLIKQIVATARILYSWDNRKRLAHLLNRYPIDISHLHSIYYHISPSILHELKKRRIPMVMTLHDYKMVCASYSMLSNGKPCEACRGGKYFKAIKHRCLRSSITKSALAALEMYLHHKILDIYNNVSIFISPSMFLKNKLMEMGFNKEIVYLPNFIDTKKFEQVKNKDEGKHQENSVVYFGRLSPEKGLWTLLNTAKLLLHGIEDKKVEIKIIGDGPMKEKLQEKVKSENINNVRFFGYMNGEALYQEIKKSFAVVLPSECYENSPIAVLEAFALGKPVIGSRIGGIPELVMDGITGYTFEAGNANDLKSKIEILIAEENANHKLGINARELVEKKFNAEIYYENLMAVYEKVLRKYGN